MLQPLSHPRIPSHNLYNQHLFHSTYFTMHAEANRAAKTREINEHSTPRVPCFHWARPPEEHKVENCPRAAHIGCCCFVRRNVGLSLLLSQPLCPQRWQLSGKPQSEKHREAVSHTEAAGSMCPGYRMLSGSREAVLGLQCIWGGGYEPH